MSRADQYRIRHTVVIACAFALLALYLFPNYWLITTSFRIENEMFAWPPVIVPTQFTLKHYQDVFQNRSLIEYFRNSFVIAVGSVTLSMVVGTLAAYSLARFKWPWNLDHHLAVWILSLRMMPPIAAALPIFLLWGRLKMIDTYHGLILAYTFVNLPFVIWMMRAFFKELPEEIEEAALIDGCSRLRVLWSNALPLVAPGLATTFLLAVLFSWNEFLFAVKLTSFNTATLPALISSFIIDRGLQWGSMSAAGTAALAPMILVALLVQRWIVSGLTLGSIK